MFRRLRFAWAARELGQAPSREAFERRQHAETQRRHQRSIALCPAGGVFSEKDHPWVIRLGIAAVKDEAELARLSVLNLVEEVLLEWRRVQNGRLGGVGGIVGRESARDAAYGEDKIVATIAQLEPVMLA